MLKTCSKCGVGWPLENFSPHKASQDGHQSACKPCRSAYATARYRADPERGRREKRESYARNLIENREKSRLRALADQRNDPDGVNQRRQKWRAANPDTDRESKRRWREANPDKVQASKDRWRKANMGRVNEAGKAWKRNNPASRRKYALARYGITPEEYDTMLDAQGGRCAICRADKPGKRAYFCVDHNHATGAVRGILCVRCNAGIGNFCENADAMLAAIDYLKRTTPGSVAAS